MNTSNVIQVISLLVTIGGAMLSLALGVALHRKMAVQAGSVFLMMTGIMVITGYIVGAPQIYTVPINGTGMALPSGICFFITGGCLLVLVNEIEFKKNN